MKVILSSNVPNRHYAALALIEAGYLEKYICAVGVTQGAEWLYKVLPEYWEKKLRGRDVSAIDPGFVESIWLPEVLQKGLSRSGYVSVEKCNWLAARIYDFMAARHVGRPDIFHFTAGVGLYSARRAKKTGTVLLCDQRAAHPDFERKLVWEECEKLGIPSPEPPGTIYDAKEKAEHALADYFIIGSEFARRTFVQAGYDPDRIFVVPYGADVRPKNSTHHVAEEKFRIIYVGQIVPRKGIHYLVQAFEELELPEAELLLVGSIGENMRPLVDEWLENSQIRTTGSVPRLHLTNYYRRSSVFVLPSVSDSWGLVVGEAMAAGLPVIVTENTGSSEMVREDKDGFIVPVRDSESLKHAILRLHEDSESRSEMGRQARQRVAEFSWESYGESLISVYQEIARREGICA